MVSLARSNLIHDWRRSLAVISILGLLGTLILVQVGLPMFMVQSFMRPITDTKADLYASGEKTRFFRTLPLDERHEGYLWMHENVKLVEAPPSSGRGAMYIDDDTSIDITSMPVIPMVGSMSYPPRFGEDIRKKIEVPGNIVVSRPIATTYELSIGDRPTINGHTAIIVGIVEDLGEVFSMKKVLMSVQSQRMFEISAGRSFGMTGGGFMIKLEDVSKVEQTKNELQAYVLSRGIILKTANEMLNESQNSFLLERSAQQNIFVAIFALVVGVAVATQTMRSGVLSQIQEYGALRALGVGLPGIARTIMEQAFWLGLLSVPAMIGMSYLVKFGIGYLSIGLAFPTVVVVSCSIMLLTVAILAGLLSLPVLYKANPSELMR